LSATRNREVIPTVKQVAALRFIAGAIVKTGEPTFADIRRALGYRADAPIWRLNMEGLAAIRRNRRDHVVELTDAGWEALGKWATSSLDRFSDAQLVEALRRRGFAILRLVPVGGLAADRLRGRAE
jgi:hypothetical protein